MNYFDTFKRSPSMDYRPELYKIYGSKTFREAIIRERLTKSIYESYLKTIEYGMPLDVSIAPEVAKVMMQWAIEQGATHYAHWFLPMTNNTACKHDAFFVPSSIGEAMLDFPSNTLVRGEPDASSFPSGGLRATFEARGYTTWDPTSPAFVRDGTLYIPSVFFSYNGEALDRKVPLLKSCEALNSAGLRFLKFFPKVSAKRVMACVGAEQEYFLIDRDLYNKRTDLKLCGRTLLGALPIKGQQLSDHYMAHIRIQVSKFMSALDQQLWELGVPAKTKHNEVAPSQHELAPVYESVNIASDHNQMMMELMRTVAKQQNLACLLHEKPFAGLNGSGKHNNYSIVTDNGYNLFKPKLPSEDDSLYLLSICAFIRSVDLYADLLRMGAASPSNDHRLGGYEAPPAIVSIFLGQQTTSQLLEQVNGLQTEEGEHNNSGVVKIVPAIPNLSVDDSDRNRTSPMALTGNKFEFRMLGSSQSIAQINTILNTILADSFSLFAERLENASDVEKEKHKIIVDVIKEHGKIIFNGNNYSKEWIEEATKRGLPNISNTVDALEAYRDEKNIKLFEKYNVLTRNECLSRYEVEMDSYVKTVSIEAKVLLQMVQREIVPAVQDECARIAKDVNLMKKAGRVSKKLESALNEIADKYDKLIEDLEDLEGKVAKLDDSKVLKDEAIYLRDVILPAMNQLRSRCDACEMIMSEESWPFPSYNKLLHSL
ncbi:glutamine synthetase type III [Histomonas meleagridis]|uniref:glutamine synthetase type III n=1 Tax=Histomonas meleagridis TaxID=135588 RepID=UPI00355AB39A|nr:glutamine synthetase type III [Histomonas meleagridis]KAH0802673.1 glutamine synthetase type III [Histomonas meleagridis]